MEPPSDTLKNKKNKCNYIDYNKEFKIKEFDIIIGNPPYNATIIIVIIITEVKITEIKEKLPIHIKIIFFKN